MSLKNYLDNTFVNDEEKKRYERAEDIIQRYGKRFNRDEKEANIWFINTFDTEIQEMVSSIYFELVSIYRYYVGEYVKDESSDDTLDDIAKNIALLGYDVYEQVKNNDFFFQFQPYEVERWPVFYDVI